MRTSEEIRQAMHDIETERRKGPPGRLSVDREVLADYIRELHERLREAKEELTYALPSDDSLIELQERINSTLSKLPEEYNHE